LLIRSKMTLSPSDHGHRTKVTMATANKPNILVIWGMTSASPT
jgi:hypothetical protein